MTVPKLLCSVKHLLRLADVLGPLQLLSLERGPEVVIDPVEGLLKSCALENAPDFGFDLSGLAKD